MKILILEDELPAANRLKKMIAISRPESEILDVLESVESSMYWLMHNPMPDLIMMDIQLSDGISLELFSHFKFTCPVIFTTAFNHFAIQAFRLDATDYLLKPLKQDELEEAMNRVEKKLTNQYLHEKISPLVTTHRVATKLGNVIKIVEFQEVAYFYSEDKITFAVLFSGKRYPLDFTLEKLETMLDMQQFQRANRQFILHYKAIGQIHTHSKSRLRLILQPETPIEVIISTEKTSAFKSWLLDNK
jgi:DNA-binding LytR/AlgR family response regulator